MKPLSRRQFLTGAAGLGVVAGASVAGATQLDGGSSHRGRAAPPTPARGAAPAPTAAPAGKGVLVLLALYGGNDGLNTLIPYADAAYLGARPSLGYQPGEVIHLDAELALHPALTELKNLWDAKRLAIVRGVGYPDPNYSHFRSMDVWQSGAPDRDEPTGWLGRYLDTTGGKDPLGPCRSGRPCRPCCRGRRSPGRRCRRAASPSPPPSSSRTPPSWRRPPTPFPCSSGWPRRAPPC